MHGRVKVRTSEEEKARKEKERQEKLKVFKHAMQGIHHKRNQGELDKDLLELTGKVLSANPDIYTLWNIRRDILTIFSKSQEFEEELPQLYDAELHLTEYCLKLNPKSYCAWHQREWVLTTRADPDWKQELTLCNTYLKFDERNFHTWDYRRFVVSHCKPSLEDEFDYTTEKLLANFSNYSAWHYRSKMLVELHPDLEGGRPIEDSHHKHELKMVQSAAFTDPDDTSAWFYQRWLLGAVKKTTNLVLATVTSDKISVAFNEYVSRIHVETNVNIIINGESVQAEWNSCLGNDYDVLWVFKKQLSLPNNVEVKVEYQDDNGEKRDILCDKHNSAHIARDKITFQKKYSQAVVDELNKQLESCRQLLSLEPDSKWTLLTTTVFLYCINAELYHKEIMQNLHLLKTLDKYRAGYYDDLITKWSIEEQLRHDYESSSRDLKISFPDKITNLPHLQYYSYCDNVDLSNHKLTSEILPTLVLLQHCKKLSLAGNSLHTLKGFPLLDLEELNLKDNMQLDQKEVEEFMSKCKYIVIF